MKSKKLLKLLGAIVLAAVLTIAFVPGCAKEAPAPTPAPAPAPTPAPAPVPTAYEKYVASLSEGEYPVPRECFEQALEEGKLDLYDWAGWWPEEIYDDFSEEFGIEVTRSYLASEEEVKTKFSLYPETPFDLVLGFSIETLAHLREVGAVQQINHDWIPNVFEYIPEKLIEMEYDPGWKYSVSHYINFPGYLYNTKYVDDPRIPSWAVLFEPEEECKGKIVLPNEMYKPIGAALKYLGYDFFSDDEAELMEAKELLLQLKPHVMTFDSWPRAALLGDECWISTLGYGDGWFLHEEYEAIVPALPAEGTKLGIGLICNPIGSPNPAAAHLFLNYLFRPEVNALLIETIRYTPTHTAVPELLSEEVLRIVTPPEGYLEKCDLFDPRAATGRGLELRTAIWEELMA